jgi:hypothetical protein
MSENVKNLHGLCAGCSNAIVGDEDFVDIAGGRYHNGCQPAVGHHQVEEAETYEIQTDDPEPEPEPEPEQK